MEAKKTAGKITKTEIELYIIDKVRELRLANKVGQKKLSLELKLSVSYVGRAEKLYTSTKYNINHLNEIARYFNVPYSYFFPATNLATDCIEDYLNKHPKVKARYEQMMRDAEEKGRLKREEKAKKKGKKKFLSCSASKDNALFRRALLKYQATFRQVVLSDARTRSFI